MVVSHKDLHLKRFYASISKPYHHRLHWHSQRVSLVTLKCSYGPSSRILYPFRPMPKIGVLWLSRSLESTSSTQEARVGWVGAPSFSLYSKLSSVANSDDGDPCGPKNRDSVSICDPNRYEKSLCRIFGAATPPGALV
jgi:hypothetical protein